MHAAATSVALVGVDPRPVSVEVHVSQVEGQGSFLIVGLPDTAVREAKERVRAAFASSGNMFPATRRVTVNLAPADLPKVGSAYDLPIALGLLAATGEIAKGAADVVALGELALDGGLRPARGGLGAGLVAKRLGKRCILPASSAGEAAVVHGAEICVAGTLADAVSAALGESPGEAPHKPAEKRVASFVDLAEVRGQLLARRAIEVAAAGGHHLLLVGPPGAGKTLLAKCLPGVLPGLGREEALEVAQAWAAAGRPRHDFLSPPFRSPHHSATIPALVGGGSGVPSPGEATLAHRGVLFLDELGEFPANLLDSLRQPLEEGVVHIIRRGIGVQFPAAFQLVAATNPCPCGYLDDRTEACRCSQGALDRYRRRMSGPLLDRFDLRVAVPRLDAEDLAGPAGEPTAAVRQRVAAARSIQEDRGVLNARTSRSRLDEFEWEPAGLELLRKAVGRLGLSGRGWDRVRRVARTVADLAGVSSIGEAHLAEALIMRSHW